ncbi:MAG: C-GCAxxG-C-C family protein [Nitrospira sp.]|nr:C-GCAxxG-C-C family protein [Nitrospira sp.]
MKQNINQSEQAVVLFKEGLSCSQAILSVFGKQFGIDHSMAMRLASGFGAGMGRMANECGAVTGAFMIIGLKYGNTTAQDREAKEKTYELVKEFAKRFKARNSSIVCKDLLGCDISTENGFQEAKQKGLISTICPKLVKDASEILEEIL